MNSYERRIRAFSIDLSMAAVLFFLLIALAALVENVDETLKLGITAAIAYFGTLIVPNFFSKGQSFGKRNQKLRVVDVKTGVPAPLVLVILREVVKGMFMLWTVGFYLVVCGIMASSRKDGRVIHDLIFRTRVICITQYASDREGTIIEQTPAMKKRMEGSTHD
jgi:uncharacterized RDD family membrane protein YckC